MFSAKILQVENGNITAVIDNKVYNVNKSHSFYQDIFTAFQKNDSESFVKLFNQKVDDTTLLNSVLSRIEKTNRDKFEFINDKLCYKGRELDGVIIDRILEIKSQKGNFDYMIAFLDNLYQNPSFRAINELYEFLEHKNLPITEDGCFLAYKSVRNDMFSKHTGSLTLLSGETNQEGRINNSVGQVVECLRSEVDDDRKNECSNGLHIGSLRYSGPSGTYHKENDVTVIVKVNPRDVVSVPRDYNAQKVRVCRYEVVSIFDQVLPSVIEEITRENLVGSIISFVYNGEQRSCLVEDVLDDGKLLVVLTIHDQKFSPSNYYRTFNFNKMESIEIVDHSR